MIYDRGDISKKPKALLLFGDASFDFKTIFIMAIWFQPLKVMNIITQ